jgi:hypothetical protein
MTIPTVRGKLHFTMILMLVTISSSTFALDPDRLGQEEDIREAVFRHQFDRNASGRRRLPMLTAFLLWWVVRT